MQELQFVFRSQAPLMMHHPRLADPLDEWTQRLSALTSIRRKTEENHREIARVEFEGGLYYSPEVGPYVPVEALAKTLIVGARLRKLGKSVERAVIITDLLVPLLYDGPREPDALWDAGYYDRGPVGVGQKRVIRTRPKFPEWALKFDVVLDDDMLNPGDLAEIATVSGRYIGLLERRPMYGRFDAIMEGGKQNGKTAISTGRRGSSLEAGVPSPR